MARYTEFNDEKFYISEHKWYWTPSVWETRWRLDHRRLDKTQDQFARELSRFFYHKMVKNSDYVDDFFKDEAKLNPQEVEQAASSKGFYTKIWDKYIPGLSPIEKAINLLALLNKQQEEQQGKSQKGKGQGTPEEQAAQAKKELMEADVEAALVRIPDKEIFESTTLNEIFNRKEGLDDFDRKIELMQKIAMVEKFGKTFDVKKTVAEKRVTNSKVHKQKRMIEYTELINSPLYQRMLPNYSAKLLSKDLVVNTPVEYEESKQKIIMLIDFSGSMSNREKQNWVLSILADRLRYCVKEECELYVSFFLTLSDLQQRRFKFTHIYNKDTALKFFKEFNTNPSGGDTQIGHVVEEIRKEIMENKRLFNLDIDLSFEKPEILIINDGQDTVKTDKLTWKTNAITLYGDNAELQRLCEKTGGKFITVTSKMDGSHASY